MKKSSPESRIATVEKICAGFNDVLNSVEDLGYIETALALSVALEIVTQDAIKSMSPSTNITLEEIKKSNSRILGLLAESNKVGGEAYRPESRDKNLN